MKWYINTDSFTLHRRVQQIMEKTAVLLVNLGTPDAPEPNAVRTYLKEFLSDPRVIDVPRWKWLPILNGIILPARSTKSAALYRSIWTEEGSPLLVISQKQKRALEKRFPEQKIKVALAMTYGNPAIKTELKSLHDWGMRHLIVLPMYPQYSSTTTASIWDRVQKEISSWMDIPKITFIRDYPDHPKFIEVYVDRIQKNIEENGEPNTVVVSYHGIPVHYAENGDDYQERCTKTTDALKKELSQLTFVQCYQSKFGNDPWLTPSTSETLEQLAKNGEKHVQVIAPGFATDCLETLEELVVENAKLFQDAGGKKYHYLPAVNDDKRFIDCLEDLVRKELD